MKRLICILMLMMLLSGMAHAEIIPDLTLVTPMPTAVPAPTEFACEAFIVNLPTGMELMDAASLAGYEAALQALYPAAGQTQLAAIHPEKDAVLCFRLMESAQLPIDAAREAALHITGSAENASEFSFGANSCAGFSHSIEQTQYHSYFFTNGSSLLLISAIGLDAAEIDSMLASLDF